MLIQWLSWSVRWSALPIQVINAILIMIAAAILLYLKAHVAGAAAALH